MATSAHPESNVTTAAPATTSNLQQQQANLEPPSYVDADRSQPTSEQCTPTVSLIPAPETEDFDPTTFTKPYSPFYRHPSTSPSTDSVRKSIRIEVRQSQDLERGLSNAPSATSLTRAGDSGVVKEWSGNRLSMVSQTGKKKGMTWPKQKRRMLANLPKKQRVAVKLLLALFVVGVMVGIAVGISAAVHGTVYKSKGSSSPIGS